MLTRTTLIQTVFSQARLAWRLVREPHVPLLTKAVLLVGVLYVIDPLDLIPDVLPVLGEIDDLTVVLLAVILFLKLCPMDAVSFHRGALARGERYSPMGRSDTIIDADYRRE